MINQYNLPYLLHTKESNTFGEYVDRFQNSEQTLFNFLKQEYDGHPEKLAIKARQYLDQKIADYAKPQDVSDRTEESIAEELSRFDIYQLISYRYDHNDKIKKYFVLKNWIQQILQENKVMIVMEIHRQTWMFGREKYEQLFPSLGHRTGWLTDEQLRTRINQILFRSLDGEYYHMLKTKQLEL